MKGSQFALLALACPIAAQSTIDPLQKDAYSANGGWIDFLPKTSHGVMTTESVLSGNAHASNFGWINFGDGSPANGVSYSNDSNLDFGVNIDPAGNLSGLAYAANVGWINFTLPALSSKDRPRIDLTSGEFSGLAYSANVGWINLFDTLSTTSLLFKDTDIDGISDSYELTYFGDLTTADATTDTDQDGNSDLQEYQANTDPTDVKDLLNLRILSIKSTLDAAVIEVDTGPGAFVTVEDDSSLKALNSGLAKGSRTYFPLKVRGTIADTISFPVSGNRFVRAFASRSPLSAPQPLDLSWVIETVDGINASGDHASLAFGPDGNPAIAYRFYNGRDLKFAAFDGNSWSIESVDTEGFVGAHCSLAFGPDGFPAIAYEDFTNRDLKFARFDGANWDLTTVDGPGAVGRDNSLAFDTDGNPTIAYVDSLNSNLKFARFDGAAWDIEVVDHLAAFISLAFAPNGQPAISYVGDSGKVKFAQHNGTSWNFVFPDSDTSMASTSLAFSPAGFPAISYYKTTSRDLKLARFDGTEWSAETVDATNSVGNRSSLGFRTDGQTIISYYDQTTNALKVAISNRDSWDFEILDTGGAATQVTSLKVGADHLAAIAYYHFSTGSLKFARQVINP